MNPQLPQSMGKDITGYSTPEFVTISALSLQSNLTTPEQIRRFELLRLAFFTLKLRKLEQRVEESQAGTKDNVRRQNAHSTQHKSVEEDQIGTKDNGTTRGTVEYQLHCSLLRHVIFQQIVTLTKLDAREQALQLIDACRK